MKYFFHKEDIEEGAPASYYELDKDWYIIRSIIVLPEAIVGSNKPYYKIPGEDGYDLTIPEGPHNPDDLIPGYEDMMTEIKKEEFDKKWEEFLASNISQWNDIKSRFKLAEKISGTPLMYFPQGIIVEIETDVYGIIPRRFLPVKENVSFDIGQADLIFEIVSYEEKFHYLGLKPK